MAKIAKFQPQRKFKPVARANPWQLRAREPIGTKTRVVVKAKTLTSWWADHCRPDQREGFMDAAKRRHESWVESERAHEAQRAFANPGIAYWAQNGKPL